MTVVSFLSSSCDEIMFFASGLFAGMSLVRVCQGVLPGDGTRTLSDVVTSAVLLVLGLSLALGR